MPSFQIGVHGEFVDIFVVCSQIASKDRSAQLCDKMQLGPAFVGQGHAIEEL